MLQQLLRQAQRTAFGQQYAFGQLLREEDWVAAFQQCVPIHDYDAMYDGWWHRSLKGEADVAWPGLVKYFALSSGTAGAASKYIPITPDMRRAMRLGALRMYSCLPKYNLPIDFYLKDWLMVGGSAQLETLGHCYVGDLSGINARKPPVWVRKFFRPGTKVAKLKQWDERIDCIVRDAHKWDIGMLMGIPSWIQLTLEKIIEHYQLDNIHQLWPNLAVYVTGGTAFEPYRRSFERLLAHPLIYQDSYLASEGFIAFQSRPETKAMRLLLNNGIFYEFVPFDEANFSEEGDLRPQAQALTIAEVQEGQDYAIVMSTCGGAWRYLIGDTVRFTDKARSEILITGRTKHFLSICGEHLSVDNMNKAVTELEQQFQLDIREFAVTGVRANHHFAHRWYLGCDTPIDKKMIAAALDDILKRLNDDYKAERSAMLQGIELEMVPIKLFYEWQREKGKMNGQSKIPRVMSERQHADWLAFLDGKLEVS